MEFRALVAWIALTWLVPTSFATAQQPIFSELAEREVETEERDEIETDRDSFTPATTTTKRGRWIVESAWSFLNNRRVPETHSLPELVARRGVNDWLEVRLGWNYEVGGAANDISTGGADPELPTERELERESQLNYGLKALLTEQSGWLPGSALIVQGGTPTSGQEPATQFAATYVFGWELAEGWKWDTAMRYGYDSVAGDHFNAWLPSTVLKFPLGERWTGHAEYFGIFTDGFERDSTKHYFSPGVHYLVTNDLEVGVRVGWGLNEQTSHFFSNIGFGWRY